MEEVQEHLRETRDSLSEKSMKELRAFIKQQKAEFSEMEAKSLDSEISDVYNRIDMLKQSPLFIDIMDQREQIHFLHDQIELQVEKYRRLKTEYKLLRSTDIDKAKRELQKTIAKESTDGTRFITLSGVSRYVSEDDIRTEFDRYGFIYDIVFTPGRQVVIEFDTFEAAKRSLDSESTIFRGIELGKADALTSLIEESSSDYTMTKLPDEFDMNDDSEYNEHSEDMDDFIIKSGTIRPSSISPYPLPSPISFVFSQTK